MVFRKWVDSPHWEYDAQLLGTDRYGTWIGCSPGTRASRPGTSFVSDYHLVALLPEDGFVATFYAGDRAPVQLYVDISTPPRIDGDLARAVDLDLDVVRGHDGRVWVDDEDEFAAHRVELGYPPEIVEAAQRSCAAVLRRVRAADPPFDGVAAAAWFEVLGR